ncbi:outer membrane beta-barrel protein [Hymenobacter psychrotolerans]|uniref:Outer membrane protein beta-barrel domain-containing protein n=1 Tax=Hymenobacter psychrotolerans DSM 18569 TaxID=1121959 RepID=A0A1M6PZM9_9BACT|nr:outer membrane beta-barrel protein [Hymenobacter psychrotolerans]SHK13398.1 Outer membrane protein beta-barrel domain-containing protein [Hymenobacter psychrotolerans DSM 18569]
MRTYLLGFLTLATAGAAQAQLSTGTVLLGGSLGYQQQTSEVEATTYVPKYEEQWRKFNISPTAGYFVAENLVVVGIRADWQQETRKYPVVIPELITPGPGPATATVLYGEYSSRRLQVGPFARYYKFFGEKAAFYGQGGVGYSSTKTTQQQPASFSDSEFKSSGFYGQLSPGFVYFPTRLFALEIGLRGLSYQRSTYGTDDYNGEKPTASVFDAGFRLRDLRLGASFYLGRQ